MQSLWPKLVRYLVGNPARVVPLALIRLKAYSETGQDHDPKCQSTLQRPVRV